MNGEEITSVCLTRWPERAAMFDDAVRMWAHQTHPHRRLLIINDGQGLRALDPRVSVVNVARRLAIGAKRNLGIEHTRTPWYSCCDDDDAYLPAHLSTLLAADQPWVRSARAWLSDAALRVVGITADTLHCTTLVRTDLARAAGGYPDVDYAEDAALATRLRRTLGIPFDSDPRVEPITYVHRRHRANVSAGHSTAGLDRQAARGRAALPWWEDPDFAAASREIAALRAAPVRGPWPLVVPVSGRLPAMVTVPRVRVAPAPFAVDGIVDATGVNAPCLAAVLRAAEEAGCMRHVVIVRGDGDRAAALARGLAGLVAPGAVAWIDARACGLRRDHLCTMVDAVRAGGAVLARGVMDDGEVGNKVAPWIPWCWPAVMVVRRTALASVASGLWSDDALPAALADGVRRAGGALETMSLDGVRLPAEARALAERTRGVVDAVRTARA